MASLAAELPEAIAVPADARRPDELRSVVRLAVERFGGLDILINNAGQGLHLPLEQVHLSDLEAITELNVYAPLVAMQAALPFMRARGGGAIVNVSSGTSRMTLPGVGAYAATKAALNQLSATARVEFASDNIVVSLVYPFITATEFHDRLRAGARPSGVAGFEPDSAAHVAQAIIGAVESGVAEVVLVPQAHERSQEADATASVRAPTDPAPTDRAGSDRTRAAR